MTKYGQTSGFKTSDFLKELEKYLESGVVDYCLVNKSKTIPKNILSRYKSEKAYPVEDDLRNGNGVKVIRANLISKKVYEKPESDKLMRSLIRHDPDKLASKIVNLIEGSD